MKKYQKFIFQELTRSMVVNLSEAQEVDHDKEEMINNVITQHLTSIVHEEQASNNYDLNEEKEQNHDIEAIKDSSYKQGAEDAKLHYESIINELRLDNNFANNLCQKIEEIALQGNINPQISKLYAQIIASIAKKIYTVLPVDFELMLKEELLARLKKFYKEGQIKLIINPSRRDFCIKILDSENLPAKYLENFHIIEDDKLEHNDCKLEWFDTSLEYNQEQLNTEIDTILEQLKQLNNLLK